MDNLAMQSKAVVQTDTQATPRAKTGQNTGFFQGAQEETKKVGVCQL